MMEGAGGGWLPAIAFLAIGLVIGAIVIARVATRAGAKPLGAPLPLPLRDLLAKRDVLLDQLRELDEAGATGSPEQLAAERYALELRAARVLRELDRHQAELPRDRAAQPVKGPAGSPTAPAGVPPVASRGGSPVSGFLWGIGVAGVVGALLFFVSQSAQQRPGTEGAPAGSAAPRGAATQDAETVRLEEAVRRNPDDLEARLELARLHLIKNDMMAVFSQTQYVLQKSPGNPRALSYQALVRIAMGQAEVAEGMLKKALAADPNLLDAYIHLMLAYTQLGRAKDADAALLEATRRHPDRGDSLQQLLGRMRADAEASAGASAQASAEDPHRGVPPPGTKAEDAPRGAAAPGAAGPAAAPQPQTPRELADEAGMGRSVAGTLELDPSAAGKIPPGAVVFVILREAGFGAGPPLAVKRLPAAAFPLAFEIGAADSMSGERIPDSVLIEARLDSDADPTTRPPSDPYGRADHVKAGVRDLRISLKPR